MLADRFDVLAVTLPGHTGGPPLPEGNSIEIVVDQLEAILDETGWESAHLVGFSLGGWLSLELAQRGRARTVTAISPGGATTEKHTRESRRIRQLFARLHLGARIVLARAEELLRRPGFRRLAFRDQMVDGGLVPPAEALDLMRAFAETPVFKRFLGEIGSDGSGLHDLDEVRVPVTILWGERDRVLPERYHGPFFRSNLPEARFEVLPDAGHVPFWEARNRIVAAVGETVDRAGVRSS